MGSFKNHHKNTMVKFKIAKNHHSYHHKFYSFNEPFWQFSTKINHKTQFWAHFCAHSGYLVLIFEQQAHARGLGTSADPSWMHPKWVNTIKQYYIVLCHIFLMFPILMNNIGSALEDLLVFMLGACKFGYVCSQWYIVLKHALAPQEWAQNVSTSAKKISR